MRIPKTNKYPIHDLYVSELKPIELDGQIRMPILSFKDHLLRRFEFAESILLNPKYQTDMKVRAVADEIWISLRGKARFTWLDLRSYSPSYEARYEIQVENPTRVLAPFGVAFGIQTLDEPVHLIRFSTHPEGEHEGDRVIPWEPG
jgi:hypothetical protein